MDDLLTSLITVSRSSEESFRSTHSDLQSTPVVPGHDTARVTPAQHAVSSHAHVPHTVYDVDAFLNDPANMALLDSATKMKFQPGPPKTSALSTSERSPIEPIQLGTTRSSHHVVLLYQLCQERGYTPVFQVEEGAPGSHKFGGRLTVGRETITIDASEASKKDARQLLAEKGCELVRFMDAKAKPKNDDASRAENWIGKLTGKLSGIGATLLCAIDPSFVSSMSYSSVTYNS